MCARIWIGRGPGWREALKGLLAGSIPCWGFCSVREVRVLTFLVPGAVVWKHSKLFYEDIAMTLRITTAALVLAAAPVFAQSSGVSRPDSAPITSDDVAPAPKPLTPRPSAAIPAAPAPATTEVYGPYVL